MLKHLRLVIPYVRRYWRYYAFGAVAIALTNVLGMLAPLVLRRAVNRLESGGNADALVMDALLIIGLAVGAGVFRFLVRRSVIWASRKIECDLRGDLFRHITSLDQSFFDRTATGDIITRASSDVEQVRMMIGPGIMQGTNTLLVGMVAIPLMMHLDVTLALFSLLPLPILALLTNYLGGIAHRRTLAVQESFSKLSSFVQESLSGIRVIKAYARETDRNRLFRGASIDYFDRNMHLVRMYGAFMPTMTLISGFAVVIVLYFGGVAVIEARIDLGTLVAFAVYLGMLIWPMVALGWVISLFQRGTASAERLGSIFGTGARVVDPPKSQTHNPPTGGSLEFRDLTFAFPNNGAAPALRGVSFRVEPGETLAIAGSTGSGKSTVVNILWRRYPIGDGMMYLGGVDANTVTTREWRSRLASVPQEPFLFSDSLRNNLAFGIGQLESDRLTAIASQAAFDKDVREFPRGYDTMIGERGLTLSGGQKQRATLARALTLDSEVLILDDAFSAVDAETEQEILDGLSDVFGTRIILLITHRIATLRRCDRVLFFDHGVLVDQGSHDEMMIHGGAYARWVQRQALREELERM